MGALPCCWYKGGRHQEAWKVDLNIIDTRAAGNARPGYGKCTWRRILVVIDPTQAAQPALEKAARIALARDCSLELYVCDVQQQIPDSWTGLSRTAEYREILRSRAQAELQALAQPLREDGLTVTVQYEWHAPLEQGIGHHVVRTQPDLVVKETHQHPAPESMAGRTDWNLIRQVPAALLLVRPGSWSASMRVAAAVDPLHPAERPAALDERIVQTGHALAGMLHGSLEVLHVLQTPPHLPGDRVAPEHKAAAHAHARHVVEQLARVAKAPTHYAEGGVAEALVHLARERTPDVLVMGAVARSRAGLWPPGGVAARILEHVDCDLLVVKPEGFVSPLLVGVG
jgi:universal stress protein E